MSPSPEEAARVREENECLRLENQRLREAVAASRPDAVADLELPLTPNSGGAMQAADRLVQLMKEGGNLLKEREALRIENAAIEAELLGVSQDGDDAGLEIYLGSAESIDDAELQISPDAVVDDSALEKLLPLLSEGDALRAEREGLRAQRKDLLGAFESTGAHVLGEAKESILVVDDDLEHRFLAAVEDVRQENANLDSEIQKLRDENTRLKRRGSNPGQTCSKVVSSVVEDPGLRTAEFSTSSCRTRRQPLTKLALDVAEEDWDSAQIRQREAMATILRSSVLSPSNAMRETRRTSPLAVSEIPERRDAKGPPDMSQEIAIKGALHTLFRSLGR